MINDKFVTDIKTKANVFNKFFAEQCTPLINNGVFLTSQLNNSVFLTSQHVLTQSRLQSIDFSFEEI